MGALEDFLLNASGGMSGPGGNSAPSFNSTFSATDPNWLPPTPPPSPSGAPPPSAGPAAPPAPMGGGQPASSPQQPQGPQLTGVKGYLANILYGMGEAAKKHIGMPTDQELSIQKQQMDLQQQRFAVETQQKQQQLDLQSKMVTLPNGMQLPWGIAQHAAGPIFSGQARVLAAQTNKRFIPIPGVGMFDMSKVDADGNSPIVAGSSPVGVVLTKEIAADYGIPDQLVGKTLPIDKFSGLIKAQATQNATVQGAQGPALVNKATGDTTSLGLGSPAQNPTAMAGLGLREQEFALRKGEQALKVYQPAMDADFRLSTMRNNLADATGPQHSQQAMVSLLTNHIGMTLGLQKGARITKDILHEAQASAPYLRNIQARFDSDGYLQGVTLPPNTMKEMVNLGEQQRVNAWRRADAQAPQLGMGEQDRPQPMEGMEPVSYGNLSPILRNAINRKSTPQRTPINRPPLTSFEK